MDIKKLIEDSKLNEGTALVLSSNFTEFEQMTAQWLVAAKTLVVTDESQSDIMKLAKEARLRIRDVRTAVEAKRKDLKSDSLNYGRAIDKIANHLKSNLEEAEAHLKQQEDYIKIQEEKRKEELKQIRTKELSEYVTDCSYMDLANMSQESYDQLLENSKIALIARQEAERKAEEERLARIVQEKEEKERLRIENEKLRQELQSTKEVLNNVEGLPTFVEGIATLTEDEILLQLAEKLTLFPLPPLESEKSKRILGNVRGLLHKISVYIQDKVGQ